jgi:hypothetical protein
MYVFWPIQTQASVRANPHLTFLIKADGRKIRFPILLILNPSIFLAMLMDHILWIYWKSYHIWIVCPWYNPDIVRFIIFNGWSWGMCPIGFLKKYSATIEKTQSFLCADPQITQESPLILKIVLLIIELVSRELYLFCIISYPSYC